MKAPTAKKNYLDPNNFLRNTTEERVIFPLVEEHVNKDDLHKYKDTASCVLGHLLHSWIHDVQRDRESRVYFSLKPEFYARFKKQVAKPQLYRHFSARRIKHVVNVLIEARLVTFQRGCKDIEDEDDKNGFSSFIQPTEVLKSIFVESSRYSPDNAERYWPYSDPKLREHILVRTGSKGQGGFKHYKETAYTRRVRKLLHSYNDMIAKHSVTQICASLNNREAAVGGRYRETKFSNLNFFNNAQVSAQQDAKQTVLTYTTDLTRIYCRGSFDCGGRFYGASYQYLIKSIYRPTLLIDDEPIAELDFGSFHTRLLYAMIGRVYDGDPYAIEGYSRDLVKWLMNVMINAKDKADVVSSFHFNKKSKVKEGMQISPSIWKDPSPLLEDIKRVHSLIKDKFHSDAGIYLQRWDSDLAAEIMDVFTRREKPILCMHDSFIVKRQDKALLYQTMMDKYIEKTGGPWPVISGY